MARKAKKAGDDAHPVVECTLPAAARIAHAAMREALLLDHEKNEPGDFTIPTWEFMSAQGRAAHVSRVARLAAQEVKPCTVFDVTALALVLPVAPK